MSPDLRRGPILVIGLGNPLRRDDAAGTLAAEAIERLGLPGVSAIATHQLLPELAEPLSTARLALFVDARLPAGPTDAGVEVLPIEPGPAASPPGHSGHPAHLLALARDLFGAVPPAWLITIPAVDLAFGIGLSPRAEVDLQDALRRISALIAAEAAG